MEPVYSSPLSIPTHLYILNRKGLFKQIWQLSWPNILTNVFINAFGLIDLFFVGKLGAEAIAAVSIGTFFVTMIFSAVIAISTGSMALITRSFGAKDEVQLRHIAGQAILLSLLMGVVLSAILYPLIPAIIHLIGCEDAVYDFAVLYSHIVVLGAFAYMGQIAINAIYRGCGDTLTPLKLVAVAMTFNAILDPILIFGFMGIPALGIAGSAIATILARIMGLSFGMIALHRKKSLIKPSYSRPDFALLKQILVIGFGGTIQMLSRNLVNLLLISLAASFGTVAIAAYGVVFRIHFMTVMMGFGFSLAAAAMIGQEIGAGRPIHSDRPAWTALILYESLLSILGIIIFFFATPIVSLFTSEAAVITLAVRFLYMLILVYPFWAFMIILGRAMMGSGDTYTPAMVNAFVLIILRVPLAWFLSMHTSLGVYGIFLAVIATDGLGGVLMLHVFRKGKWKKFKIKELSKTANL